MACNYYSVTFSSSATITFLDCSGTTQTFSGDAGLEYAICAQTTPEIPDGVTIKSGGESSYYLFSSCCGNYFFYLCLQNSDVSSLQVTFGSEYYLFNDGKSTTGKCVYLDTTITPPVIDAPYVIAYQLTSAFGPSTNEFNQCNSCHSILPGNECIPFYFKLCCCDYSGDTIPLDCYVAWITKTSDFSVGDIITLDFEGGESICVEYVDQNSENFYSITEYGNEVTGYTFYNTCSECILEYPCPNPTPTPTPTPTITPTPTPTPKPPLTPKALDFINECAVITLFPMGVECVITNPSPEGSDGSVFLNITGGTPPYSITWENGNIGPNLYNLTAGTYKSVVTDFYKDFTANTECVLTGSTPVPSPTPTPTPTPPYIEYNLCMQTSIVKGEDTINENTPFIPNGILNGRPSWISFDSTSIMYWNDENSNWVVSSSTNNDVIVCANPAYPPIFGSWFILGNGTVYVSSGSCEGEVLLSVPNRYSIVIGQPLRLSVSNNEPVCGCDGNITLVANGGTPPYLYTIDSGLTYKTFPIFNDLCSGLYAVKVKDSTGLEVDTTTILSSPTRPITYSVSFNTTNTITSVGSLERIVEYTTTISVSPELPDGVTLTFDLSHMNVSQTSPNFSSSTFVNSSYLSINDVVQPITISYETGTTFNVLAGCQNNTTYKSMTTDYWYGIQYNNTTNLVIKTISEIYKIDEVDCYLGLSDETYQISNISINGCDCCNVITT